MDDYGMILRILSHGTASQIPLSSASTNDCEIGITIVLLTSSVQQKINMDVSPGIRNWITPVGVVHPQIHFHAAELYS